MTQEMRKIKVVPYDPHWPQQYAEEAVQLQKTLDNDLIAIHHVGSTAVPGLIAKPKIDIVAVVHNPVKAIGKLTPLGYDYRGEYNIPFHYGFSKRSGVRVNLHMYQEGNPEIELNLTFRDSLRQNASLRDEYAALKNKLLMCPTSFVKDDSIFTGYNLGKDAFISRVLNDAGFKRLRFLHCTHRLEWDAANKLREKVGVAPYQPTNNKPDHKHFILCLGSVVIGYAHILLLPNARASIGLFTIEPLHYSQEHAKWFLQSIQTWLIQHDFILSSLHETY